MSGLNPKASSRVICLILLIFLSSSCSQKPVVRVGFTAELSGKQGELGVHLRNGVQMAVDEINNAGGINGRKIELLVEDDLGTPQGAVIAENKLIDAGSAVILGHFTSNQTIAGYSVAEQRGVILISATASTSLLSTKKDLFFRTVASTDAMAKYFARYIHQSRRLSRVAIIYDQDNSTYTESMSQVFSDTFTSLGGQVSGPNIFSEAASLDFSPMVEKMMASNPDCVLIIASPGSTALIAQNIYLKNWSIPIFSSSWAQGETLIQNGGKSVENLEIIIAFDVNDQSPELNAFKTNYQKQFSHAPIFTAMEGYETMQMLAAALQGTHGEAKGLGEALAALKDFKGLTGSIQMDEYGDAIRPLYIQKVHEQKFETVVKIISVP